MSDIAIESSSHRRLVVFTTIVGLLSLAGAILFAIVGAGTYGSPIFIEFHEFGAGIQAWSLIGILVFGPLMILPAALVERFKRPWGGLFLCGNSLVTLLMLAINNNGLSGFLVYNVWTGFLFVCLPMFVIGSLMIRFSRASSPWINRLWFGLMTILILSLLPLLWEIRNELRSLF